MHFTSIEMNKADSRRRLTAQAVYSGRRTKETLTTQIDRGSSWISGESTLLPKKVLRKRQPSTYVQPAKRSFRGEC